MKRTTCVAALVLLTAMAGCGDDNPARPNPQPSYLPSSTPQNVLENLRRAYIRRDSTAYDSLFDASYAGTSIDQLAPIPVLVSFTKADESQHIGVMARSTINSITMNLVPNLVRFQDAGDPPGWATIQDPFQTFVIYADPDFWLIVPPTVGTISSSFKFAPTTPSPGSQTDTTWHIVGWTEVRN